MAEHRYRVRCVIIDTSDYSSRLDDEVTAVSDDAALKKVLRKHFVGKRDLVRDIHVSRLDAE